MSHRDPDDDLILHKAPPGLVEQALAEEQASRTPFVVGLMAAAALIGVAVGQVIERQDAEPAKVVVHAVQSDLVEVRFQLDAPNATEVAVVGSFNDWDVESHKLARGSDGLFATTLDLESGRHEYLFVVDGSWVLDPAATLTHDDGFGARNAVLEI